MKVQYSQSAEKPLIYRLQAILRNLLHYCSRSSSSNSTLCKKYGHRVAGAPVGVGEQHFCSDCGAKVKGPEELRKAAFTSSSSPTRETGDGSWR